MTPADRGCDGCAPEGGRRQFLRDCLGFGLALAFVPPRIGGGGAAARYPVPTADGVFIDKEQDVILVRWKGAVYAFARSCPHQNTALKWDADDTRFQCPKHHSKYQPDGTFISGRATRAMDRFPVKIEGAEVVVNLDTLYHQDKQPQEWSAAMVRVPPA